MTETVFIPVTPGARLSAVFQQPLKEAAPEAEKEEDNEEEKNNPPATLVIMMHGFPGGHKSACNDVFGDLEHQLSQDGVASLRFDFRGCGESEGTSENFTLKQAGEDLQMVLKWSRRKGFERFIYVGESLGATIGLMNAAKDTRAFVMLWPALDPRHTFLKNVIARADTAGDGGDIEYEDQKIGRPFIDELRNFNPIPFLKELKAPLLVQHGQQDKDVPLIQLELLRRYAKQTRRIELTTYEKGEHGLRQLNERQTLFHHVRQFINRYA